MCPIEKFLVRFYGHSSQFLIMNAFVRNLLANLAAFGIIGLLGLGLVFYLFVFIIVIVLNKPESQIASDSVLVVDLTMNVSDAPAFESVYDVIDEVAKGPKARDYALLEIVHAIHQARDDERIKAMFLHGSLLSRNYGSGMAVLEELRGAILEFKASGKPVYAYIQEPSLRDYYLMSVADTVAMNPFGLLAINGLANNGAYFGDALKRYGIGVQTTRVGKYKSAVEVFTSNEMSEPDRLQIEAILNGVWQQITKGIAESRGIEHQELLTLSDNKGFFTAELAKQEGLIDEVAYFGDMLQTLKTAVDAPPDHESFPQVSLAEYMQDSNKTFKTEDTSKPVVTVLYAQGEIVDGEGYPDQIGGDRIARILRSLRQDERVAAIVLRVNSPGGSAIASEVIQREVRQTQEVKPVVVSMSSLAASGGYWISAYADKILAEPTTITGSIGVWGLLFNIQEIANSYGVNFDGVQTSKWAGIDTITRPKTPQEMALIQEFTDLIYDAFIQKVAQGRDLPAERVEEIAQGRVWTGEQALSIGLVDEMGGLEDAIAVAANLAEIGENWHIEQIPEKKSFGESIREFLSPQENDAPLAVVGQDLYTQMVDYLQNELRFMRSFNDPRGVYARLPYRLEF